MASLFIPTKCGTLQIGDHLLIENKPCKISALIKAKTGKHGCSKAHFVGIDIFTEQKYEFMETTSSNVDVPIITKNSYQLVDIDKDTGSVSYFDASANLLNDLFLPDLCDSDYELADKLQDAFKKEKFRDIFITVISSMGITAIKDFKLK